MTPVERLMAFVALWNDQANPRGIAHTGREDAALARVYGSRGAIALTITDIESVVAENIALRAQLEQERLQASISVGQA